MNRLTLIITATLTSLSLSALAAANNTLEPPTQSSHALPQQARASQTPVSNIQVLAWSNTALMQIFSLGPPLHLRQNLSTASHYFTPTAWQAFTQTLAQSELMHWVKNKNMAVKLVPTDVPIIQQQGTHQNKYHWAVSMPALIVAKNAQQTIKRHWNITLWVTTANTHQGINGLAIQTVIVKPIAMPQTQTPPTPSAPTPSTPTPYQSPSTPTPYQAPSTPTPGTQSPYPPTPHTNGTQAPSPSQPTPAPAPAPHQSAPSTASPYQAPNQPTPPPNHT